MKKPQGHIAVKNPNSLKMYRYLNILWQLLAFHPAGEKGSFEKRERKKGKNNTTPVTSPESFNIRGKIAKQPKGGISPAP